MDRTFKLTVAGREYEAQPLPIGALRRFTREGVLEKLDLATSGKTADILDALGAVVAVISAALKPRYPECDEAWVEANVPVGPKGFALLRGVLRESGMVADHEGDGGPNAASPSV